MPNDRITKSHTRHLLPFTNSHSPTEQASKSKPFNFHPLSQGPTEKGLSPANFCLHHQVPQMPNQVPQINDFELFARSHKYSAAFSLQQPFNTSQAKSNKLN